MPVRSVDAVVDEGPTVEVSGSVMIPAATLLSNDVDSEGNVGSDELKITAVRAPERGTVWLEGSMLTFTHDGTSAASDGYTFIYEVVDGINGTSDTARVTGAVIQPNRAPIVSITCEPCQVIRGG